MNSSHATSYSLTIALYVWPHRAVSSTRAGRAARAVFGLGAVPMGLHVAFEGVPVLHRRQPDGVADQMDDAGPHRRRGHPLPDDRGQIQCRGHHGTLP